MPEVRTLPSAGITRFQQYYDPLRLLCGPPCSPRRWVRPDHDRSPPITRIALPACCAHYPGGSIQVHVFGFLPWSVLPSPLHRRVGIRIATFEACSGFTRVTARWLAQPPKGDLCHKAPARSVTQTSRLSATRPNRLLSRWNPPPLATRACGAHCAKSRGEARQRAQRRGAILRTRSAVHRAGAYPTKACDSVVPAAFTSRTWPPRCPPSRRGAGALRP